MEQEICDEELGAGGRPAGCRDVGGGTWPPISTTVRTDRYGSAYDDPRYADIYRYPDTRHPVPREPAYRPIATRTTTATTTARRAATPTPIRAAYARRAACRASTSSIA